MIWGLLLTRYVRAFVLVPRSYVEVSPHQLQTVCVGWRLVHLDHDSENEK